MEALEPDPARDDRIDGPEAWRNVAVAFVAMLVVFAVAYSFGSFFGPMAEEFGASAGATSLVFSLTAGIWFVLGPVSGRAVDRYGPRPVLLAGAVALAGGLSLTATVDRLWIGYLTYGLGVGGAVACGYLPMVAIVGGWFERRRATALGVAVSGIGIGTLGGAPLSAALVRDLGWRPTYVILGAAGGLALAACAVFATAPPAADGQAPPSVGRLVRSRNFVALYLSLVLISLAIFVPFVFLPAFATARGVDAVAAAALVGIIGISSVGGRLLVGPVADRFGSVGAYKTCFAIMAVGFAVWLVSDEYVHLLVFALVLGIGYGGFVALNTAVVADLFGVRGLGRIVGLLFTGAAVGSVAGSPGAGLLIDATGGYRWAIGATTLAAAASFLALLPVQREPT